MEKGRNQGLVSQSNCHFNWCCKEFLKIPYRNTGCKSPINVTIWNERLLLTGHIWLPWVRAPPTFTLLPAPTLHRPSLHTCFGHRRWSQRNRKSFLWGNSQGSLHMHIELKPRWFSRDRKAALWFKCDIKATCPQQGKNRRKGRKHYPKASYLTKCSVVGGNN